MADKKITKRPKAAVSKLAAPSRTTPHKMTATWKVPEALTSKKYNNRAEHEEVTWTLNLSDGTTKSVVQTGAANLASSEINLDSLKIGGTTYGRASFYPGPNGDKPKLNSVSVKVVPTNRKGKGKKPHAEVTKAWKVPRAPTIDEITFDNATGIASTTIRTDPGEDDYERYDTKYEVAITDSRTGKTVNSSDSASTSTEFSVNYNFGSYQSLDPENDYIQMQVRARARGYAGDAEATARNLYVGYPAQVSITGVSFSSKTETGKCTIGIKTNSTDQHHVDQVRLEYAADVSYETAAEIPNEAWTSTDIVDDADCTALATSVGNLLPSRGKHTYIRVKSYHLNEAVLYRYSDVKTLEDLETPAAAAADISIKVLSVEAGAGGESAVVTLGWNADGADDYTGTELSWSDEEDTWKSTEEPKTHEFAWSDGPKTVGGVTYQDSAEITIKGLSEGTKYFVKARRYLDTDTTTYSAYSNTETVITTETPETIVAVCDRYVVSNGSLPLRWTLSGNGLQAKWQVVSSDGKIIADGEGSIGATQISADRLATFASNGTVTFTVQASTGSGWVSSEPQKVTIMQPPTLSISRAASLTAQPVTFTATASSQCDLIVILTSKGAVGQFPQGVLRQTAGDTIHSDVYKPTWTASGNNFTATITLPGGLDLWDGGGYTLSVVAVDRATKLRSSERTADFKVAWANPAVSPEDATTLTVQDTIDEDGIRTRAVEITLTAPTGASETDVYDIYRMDGDEVRLIGEGFPLEFTTVDTYAPFGTDEELFYRIALRTVDGDVEYDDVEYEFPCDSLRFDWAGGSLELPYNLAIGDKYAKDTDIRQHLDGSSDAYWNPNITRTASLKTDVVPLYQDREIEAVRRLARYPGAVFVRTPNGCAYEADVQVSDMSSSNKKLVAVSFDATQVGLTREFMLPIPFELEEE
jgi:hypothetical protein